MIWEAGGWLVVERSAATIGRDRSFLHRLDPANTACYAKITGIKFGCTTSAAALIGLIATSFARV
jgi:hypothetical protein